MDKGAGRYARYDCNNGCPVETARAGGKWKGVILYHLDQRIYLFSELQQVMSGVPRMLTKQLRELEDDGLISRRCFQRFRHGLV